MIKAISNSTNRLIVLLLCAFCVSCHQRSCDLEPNISYQIPERCFNTLSPAFDEISPGSYQYPWGRELLIAHHFAHDWDFYRAITAWKRAAVLLPPKDQKLWNQIDYSIILAYYLNHKHCDVIETFEKSELSCTTPATFRPYEDLLVILQDSYYEKGEREKARQVHNLIQPNNPEQALNLSLGRAIKEGDLATTRCLAQKHPCCEQINGFLQRYCGCAKSVQKAQLYNAFLPGAGYLYVGQKHTALTSFILNAVFIATTYQFAKKGLTFPAIISGSLEFGWYVGGINGAGLAAKEYNERLYENLAKDVMIDQKLFPVLMLQHGF